MSDIPRRRRAQHVKLSGADNSGLEQDYIESGTKEDGSTKALHTIAQIENGSEPIETDDKYGNDYFVEESRSNTSIPTGSNTVIYSRAGTGVLESFWAEMSNENFRFILVIDGITTIDVDMRVFKDAGIASDYALAPNLPLIYEDGSKTMLFRPNKSIKYNTSLSIEFRGSGGTSQVRGWVVSEVRE